MVPETCQGCGQRLVPGMMRCPRCQTIAPRYAEALRPTSVPRAEVPAAHTASGARAMSLRQLRAVAKANGLSAGGTAAQLADRIAAHESAAAKGGG